MSLSKQSNSGQVSRLLKIMQQLRDPVIGCPWDQKQSFASIVPHTIEEAYELAEAILSGDTQDVKDELGDLLFQVVFYAQLGKEQGDFDFDDSDGLDGRLEGRQKFTKVLAEGGLIGEARMGVGTSNIPVS